MFQDKRWSRKSLGISVKQNILGLIMLCVMYKFVTKGNIEYVFEYSWMFFNLQSMCHSP